MNLKEEKGRHVEAEIIRGIRENGPMTFAAFMEAALYCPEGGYYTSPGGRWGEKGDYITSLDVSPVFSKLLAKQIHEMWVLSGSSEGFTLIEAGAGRGWLSKGILATLKEFWRPLYDVIKVRLIEKNPYLRGEPSQRVEPSRMEKPYANISWHEDFTGLERPACACVLSNELIDSFPVHRVLWVEPSQMAGELKEIYVDYVDGRFVERLGEPSTDELAAYIKDSGIEPVDGMIMEINLNACKWLETVSAFISNGFVITIDYGLPARELYSPERCAGSLMCHYRHTLNDNPYINVGRQDITAHVDFSMLMNRGNALGLRLTGFTTQKNFFLGLGIIEELKEADASGPRGDDYEKIKYNRALAQLISPGGMGDTFKVMVQHKGMEERPSLKGFSFKDMSRCL